MSTSKVTLNDVYAVVNRLEDKVDKRLCEVDMRVNRLEELKAQAALIVSILAVVVSVAISWAWNKIFE